MKKMYLSKDGIVKEPYTTVRFLYNPSVKRKGRHYFCASTLSVFLAGSSTIRSPVEVCR